FAYNSDDGIFFGAGAAFQHYGFRKTPYAGYTSIKGNVSFATGAFRLGFEGNYIQAIGGLRLNVLAYADRPRIRNYYGLGNNTKRHKNFEKNEFYEIKSEELFITPLLHHDFSSRSTFYFGAGFRRFTFDAEDNTGTLIVIDQPHGLSINETLEFTAGITMDFREAPIFPTKGSLWSFGISHVPKALDNDSSYTKGSALARFYVSPSNKLTLAFGAGAEKIWGGFPYYDAAYLGGTGTLRGFPRERFAGEASINGVAAAMLKLFRYYFLFPTDFGMFILGDAGRVWLDGESPGGWHTSFGGGVFFSPTYRKLTFSIGAAQSDEGLRFSFGGGFKF
ncbi:MAG: BamA/TamA family outer membrane protein, partial [bacterium]